MVLTVFLLDTAFQLCIGTPLLAAAERTGIYWPELPDWTPWQLLAGLVLLGPLFEEAVCRGPLRYRRWYASAVSREAWDKRVFPALTWLSILAFGALHISNAEFAHYDPRPTTQVVRVFTILPQLFGGMTLTYVRVRLNFWWAWSLHAAWNAFALFLF